MSLPERLTAAIDAREREARELLDRDRGVAATTLVGWVVAACTAYREILAEHCRDDYGRECVGCGAAGDESPRTEEVDDCPTLLAVARALSLTCGPQIVLGDDDVEHRRECVMPYAHHGLGHRDPVHGEWSERDLSTWRA